ncbi:hypothetical protein M422DRAFT_241428 [Sphaerobolus stellatus SS14]|nr:hypothetical protein M422DRAFT_241428 [Sphaerobolus stellatus SS14]
MSTTSFQSKHQIIQEHIIAHILNTADYHPQLPDLDKATWVEVAHGFRDLCTWTGHLFCPLLDVAHDTSLHLKWKMEKSKTQKSKNKETTAHSESMLSYYSPQSCCIFTVTTNVTLNPPANSIHSSPTAHAPCKTMSSSNQLLAKKMLLGTKTTAPGASPLLPRPFLVPLQSQGSRFNGYQHIPKKPISVDDNKSSQQIAGLSNLKSLKNIKMTMNDLGMTSKWQDQSCFLQCNLS